MSQGSPDEQAPALPAAPSDEVYRGLVDAVVDYAIFRLDPQGKILSWNPGAQAIKGYEAQEVLGRHFSHFFTEEDRAAGVPDRVLQAARDHGRVEVEGWRVRRDGRRFWALAVVDAIYGADGSIIGFAKITRDMTERRAAQKALEESERQFRLLVAGVSDYAIYMIDPTGVVTSWNAGAEKIKGYGAAEIIGRHFSLFYAPEDAVAGLPRVALDTARATGSYEAEGWRLRKDGTRFWANVVIDAIRDEGGELIGFAKITRDITERKETERRLVEVREQLHQSQKMEAIGQLTGGVAHDFNNLLTAIVGGVSLARRKIGDADALARILDNVAEAAERGASLTKHLLAFSRRQSLSPEPIALKPMLATFAELLARSIGADIEIVIEAVDEVSLLADVRQLELALLNVGLNARDAMPEGGRLTIEAHRRTLDGEAGGLTGDFVAISISDVGEGMPTEVRDRVFEPFYTTKEVGRGTGLGLSQAYGFAQQSGGAVLIDSEVGVGTTITFLLPQAEAASAASGTDAVVRRNHGEIEHDLTGNRILVVEDDASVAEISCSLLREAGAEVEHARSVDAALVAIDDMRFDLIFSDVVMPGGLSGFDLARRLGRERPDLAVVLTTGYGGTTPSSSEFTVLPKPYDSAELFRVMAESLHAHRLPNTVLPA